jgi:hypothetical protein
MIKNTTVCGIDPGKKGGIVVLDRLGHLCSVVPIPMIGDVYNYSEIIPILLSADFVMIEAISYHGIAMKGLESLIHHVGVLEGLCIAFNIAHNKVTPAVWKKAIGLPTMGIVRKTKSETPEQETARKRANYQRKKAGKNDSIELALRLFPNIGEFGVKIGDGIAEAALIAEYARRTR